MAVLAAFSATISDEKNLSQFLKQKVFADVKASTIAATPEEMESYDIFIRRYKAGLEIEREAVKNLKKGL
jgi:hypothetical protein